MRALALIFATAGLPGVAFAQTETVGQLPCAGTSTATIGDCQYEIVRKENGDSTVRVLLPGGTVRSLYFEAGTITSSDSAASLLAEKQSDSTLIFIGDEERFEIPDALVAPN